MAAALIPIGEWAAGALASDATVAAGAGVAADAAATGAGAAVAGGTAATAGAAATGAAAAGTVDATAGLAETAATAVASQAVPALPSIAAGVGDTSLGSIVSTASAAATTGSALYTLAQGRGGINIPPSPQMATADQDSQAAGQAALARAQSADGLQGSTGTAGGQAGAMLNPATMSNKSLLGA